jgi:hypothetical protein
MSMGKVELRNALAWFRNVGAAARLSRDTRIVP